MADEKRAWGPLPGEVTYKGCTCDDCAAPAPANAGEVEILERIMLELMPRGKINPHANIGLIVRDLKRVADLIASLTKPKPPAEEVTEAQAMDLWNKIQEDGPDLDFETFWQRLKDFVAADLIASLRGALEGIEEAAERELKFDASHNLHYREGVSDGIDWAAGYMRAALRTDPGKKEGGYD